MFQIGFGYVDTWFVARLGKDALAAVGSANMDIRSFYLNYEVTAMFYDARVNDALARQFETDLAVAQRIRAQARSRLPVGRRALEAWARVLSPLL